MIPSSCKRNNLPGSGRRHDIEPSFPLFCCRKCAVVSEEHCRAVASLQRDLCGALDVCEAVGAERMPQPVMDARDARSGERLGDSAGERAFFRILRANSFVSLPLFNLCKPRCERGDDRHDATAPRLCVVSLNNDIVLADILPFKAADFGAAESGKSANGKDREKVIRRGCEHLSEVAGRVNCDLGGFGRGF